MERRGREDLGRAAYALSPPIAVRASSLAPTSTTTSKRQEVCVYPALAELKGTGASQTIHVKAKSGDDTCEIAIPVSACPNAPR